ncbi:MAG: ribose-5-phosphate isomerase [Anaerolineae bacterium]|nr:ribose-5-phosphate isomerase [Anaerolineae bacterium]
MKIAVINETSAADRNADILAALQGRGHEIINVGMKKNGEKPELQYIHTGLMAAILLNLGRVQLVVGGCGTGQGFLNAVMQYPGVVCGHILCPLDAWLFAQINAGNCLSLALNQGYGWASDVNLRMIFDQFFSVEMGGGYPPHRRQPQAASREMLRIISSQTHRPFAQILAELSEEVVRPAMEYPGFRELLEVEKIADEEVRTALLRWDGTSTNARMKGN